MHLLPHPLGTHLPENSERALLRLLLALVSELSKEQGSEGMHSSHGPTDELPPPYMTAVLQKQHKYWQDSWKNGTLHSTGKKCKLVQLLLKQYKDFSPEIKKYNSIQCSQPNTG